jgi:tripartite-type tricarboxylate transporter receptor subunit TctC
MSYLQLQRAYRFSCTLKVGALLLMFVPWVNAQDLALSYPNKPVRIIAPQAPGGGVDLVGRILIDQMRLAMGQPFLLDNEAGAGGAIAAKMTSRATPDGYTLMIGYVATHGTTPAVKKGIYDPIKDFTAIAMLGGTPNVLVINKNLPVNNLGELVIYAKEHPTQTDYGTSGVGTLNHLLMEQFKNLTGMTSQAIAYRSIGQAFTDSIGGHIQIIFPGLSAGLPHIRNGSFKALAVTGETRHALLPDVPTFKESGYEGFNGLTWYGIVGPPKLPDAIRNKLNVEINKILSLPQVRKSFSEQALNIMPMSPKEFENYIQLEVKHWHEVAVTSKIALE